MKYLLIFLTLVFFTPETIAAKSTSNEGIELNDGGKRKKDGSYRKKKHLLKKLIQGKRYCDCPKH